MSAEEELLDKEFPEILKTEFSADFVAKMKARMITSFFKYGPVAKNAGEALERVWDSMEKRLNLYKETGNTEWLVDAANFIMMEYMFPQHPKAHFRATDSNESPGVEGTTIKAIEALMKKKSGNTD